MYFGIFPKFHCMAYGRRSVRRRFRRRRTVRRSRRPFRRGFSRRPSFRRRSRRSFRIRSPGKSVSGRQKHDVTIIRHRRGIFAEKQRKWDVLRSEGAGRATASAGLQEWLSRSFLQGGSKFTGGNHGTGFGSDLVAHGYTPTASGVYPSNNIVRRMCLSSEVQLKFINFSNVVTTCTLYILRMRKGLQGYASQYSARAMQPHLMFAHLYNSHLPISPLHDADSIGASPYDIAEFGSFCKIIQRRQFTLDAGATCSHTIKTYEYFSYNWNKLGYGQAEAETCSVWLPGRTYGFMMSFHGTPASDTTTPSLVNISPSSIGYSYVFKMKTSTQDHQAANNVSATNALDPRSGDGSNIIMDETGAAAVVDIV